MQVPYCHICDGDAEEKKRYGNTGLSEGEYCPVCFLPYCRFHGGVVRWRWRSTGQLDSGKVCKQCKTAYLHRTWDAVNRDWIS
jgi:hypothetical protein